jgi:hypothetical protein
VGILMIALVAVRVGTVSGRSLVRAAGHPQAPLRSVGVTLDSGPKGPGQAFRLFQRAGANGIEAPQAWNQLEPRPGHFRLGDVNSIVAGVRPLDTTRIMWIPAAIETTRRSVPAGLRRARWDSRRMLATYRALIARAAPHLSPQVAYISIANEADVYLGAHPRQVGPFMRFARAEIGELRRRLPWAKVGVTVTYSGLVGARPGLARALAQLGNATIVTYYPLGAGYRPRPAASPLADIPAMVALAHGRPLVVQEAGYPSASSLHSSPFAQAAFVRNVFDAWNRTPRAIPFLSFYTLFDPPARECGQTEALAFLCSLGLRDGNGRPKPAWSAFRTGVRSIVADSPGSP